MATISRMVPAVLRGLTPNQVAAVLRCSPGRVYNWIETGDLAAVNLAGAGTRPRYTILPAALDDFCRARQAAPAPKPPPRKRAQAGAVDYYP